MHAWGRGAAGPDIHRSRGADVDFGPRADFFVVRPMKPNPIGSLPPGLRVLLWLPLPLLLAAAAGGCVSQPAVQLVDRPTEAESKVRILDPNRLASRADVEDLTVHVHAGDKCGTGVLVGPNAVLTARHVIEGSRRVSIRLKTETRYRDVLRGIISKEDDLALLVIESDSPAIWECFRFPRELRGDETALVCGYPGNRFALMHRKVLGDSELAGAVDRGASGSGAWVRRGNRYVLGGILHSTTTKEVPEPRTYMTPACKLAGFLRSIRNEYAEAETDAGASVTVTNHAGNK